MSLASLSFVEILTCSLYILWSGITLLCNIHSVILGCVKYIHLRVLIPVLGNNTLAIDVLFTGRLSC